MTNACKNLQHIFVAQKRLLLCTFKKITHEKNQIINRALLSGYFYAFNEQRTNRKRRLFRYLYQKQLFEGNRSQRTRRWLDFSI